VAGRSSCRFLFLPLKNQFLKKQERDVLRLGKTSAGSVGKNHIGGWAGNIPKDRGF